MAPPVPRIDGGVGYQPRLKPVIPAPSTVRVNPSSTDDSEQQIFNEALDYAIAQAFKASPELLKRLGPKVKQEILDFRKKSSVFGLEEAKLADARGLSEEKIFSLLVYAEMLLYMGYGDKRIAEYKVVDIYNKLAKLAEKFSSDALLGRFTGLTGKFINTLLSMYLTIYKKGRAVAKDVVEGKRVYLAAAKSDQADQPVGLVRVRVRKDQVPKEFKEMTQPVPGSREYVYVHFAAQGKDPLFMTLYQSALELDQKLYSDLSKKHKSDSKKLEKEYEERRLIKPGKILDHAVVMDRYGKKEFDEKLKSIHGKIKKYQSLFKGEQKYGTPLRDKVVLLNQTYHKALGDSDKANKYASADKKEVILKEANPEDVTEFIANAQGLFGTAFKDEFDRALADIYNYSKDNFLKWGVKKDDVEAYQGYYKARGEIIKQLSGFKLDKANPKFDALQEKLDTGLSLKEETEVISRLLTMINGAGKLTDFEKAMKKEGFEDHFVVLWDNKNKKFDFIGRLKDFEAKVNAVAAAKLAELKRKQGLETAWSLYQEYENLDSLVSSVKGFAVEAGLDFKIEEYPNPQKAIKSIQDLLARAETNGGSTYGKNLLRSEYKTFYAQLQIYSAHPDQSADKAFKADLENCGRGLQYYFTDVPKVKRGEMLAAELYEGIKVDIPTVAGHFKEKLIIKLEPLKSSDFLKQAYESALEDEGRKALLGTRLNKDLMGKIVKKASLDIKDIALLVFSQGGVFNGDSWLKLRSGEDTSRIFLGVEKRNVGRDVYFAKEIFNNFDRQALALVGTLIDPSMGISRKQGVELIRKLLTGEEKLLLVFEKNLGAAKGVKELKIYVIPRGGKAFQIKKDDVRIKLLKSLYLHYFREYRGKTPETDINNDNTFFEVLLLSQNMTFRTYAQNSSLLGTALKILAAIQSKIKGMQFKDGDEKQRVIAKAFALAEAYVTDYLGSSAVFDEYARLLGVGKVKGQLEGSLEEAKKQLQKYWSQLRTNEGKIKEQAKTALDRAASVIGGQESEARARVAEQADAQIAKTQEAVKKRRGELEKQEKKLRELKASGRQLNQERVTEFEQNIARAKRELEQAERRANQEVTDRKYAIQQQIKAQAQASEWEQRGRIAAAAEALAAKMAKSRAELRKRDKTREEEKTITEKAEKIADPLFDILVKQVGLAMVRGDVTSSANVRSYVMVLAEQAKNHYDNLEKVSLPQPEVKINGKATQNDYVALDDTFVMGVWHFLTKKMQKDKFRGSVSSLETFYEKWFSNDLEVGGLTSKSMWALHPVRLLKLYISFICNAKDPVAKTGIFTAAFTKEDIILLANYLKTQAELGLLSFIEIEGQKITPQQLEQILIKGAEYIDKNNSWPEINDDLLKSDKGILQGGKDKDGIRNANLLVRILQKAYKKVAANTMEYPDRDLEKMARQRGYLKGREDGYLVGLLKSSLDAVMKIPTSPGLTPEYVEKHNVLQIKEGLFSPEIAYLAKHPEKKGIWINGQLYTREFFKNGEIGPEFIERFVKRYGPLLGLSAANFLIGEHPKEDLGAETKKASIILFNLLIKAGRKDIKAEEAITDNPVKFLLLAAQWMRSEGQKKGEPKLLKSLFGEVVQAVDANGKIYETIKALLRGAISRWDKTRLNTKYSDALTSKAEYQLEAAWKIIKTTVRGMNSTNPDYPFALMLKTFVLRQGKIDWSDDLTLKDEEINQVAVNRAGDVFLAYLESRKGDQNKLLEELKAGGLEVAFKDLYQWANALRNAKFSGSFVFRYGSRPEKISKDAFNALKVFVLSIIPSVDPPEVGEESPFIPGMALMGNEAGYTGRLKIILRKGDKPGLKAVDTDEEQSILGSIWGTLKKGFAEYTNLGVLLHTQIQLDLQTKNLLQAYQLFKNGLLEGDPYVGHHAKILLKEYMTVRLSFLAFQYNMYALIKSAAAKYESGDLVGAVVDLYFATTVWQQYKKIAGWIGKKIRADKLFRLIGRKLQGKTGIGWLEDRLQSDDFLKKHPSIHAFYQWVITDKNAMDSFKSSLIEGKFDTGHSKASRNIRQFLGYVIDAPFKAKDGFIEPISVFHNEIIDVPLRKLFNTSIRFKGGKSTGTTNFWGNLDVMAHYPNEIFEIDYDLPAQDGKAVRKSFKIYGKDFLLLVKIGTQPGPMAVDPLKTDTIMKFGLGPASRFLRILSRGKINLPAQIRSQLYRSKAFQRIMQLNRVRAQAEYAEIMGGLNTIIQAEVLKEIHRTSFEGVAFQTNRFKLKFRSFYRISRFFKFFTRQAEPAAKAARVAGSKPGARPQETAPPPPPIPVKTPDGVSTSIPAKDFEVLGKGGFIVKQAPGENTKIIFLKENMLIIYDMGGLSVAQLENGNLEVAGKELTVETFKSFFGFDKLDIRAPFRSQTLKGVEIRAQVYRFTANGFEAIVAPMEGGIGMVMPRSVMSDPKNTITVEGMTTEQISRFLNKRITDMKWKKIEYRFGREAAGILRGKILDIAKIDFSSLKKKLHAYAKGNPEAKAWLEKNGILDSEGALKAALDKSYENYKGGLQKQLEAMKAEIRAKQSVGKPLYKHYKSGLKFLRKRLGAEAVDPTIKELEARYQNRKAEKAQMVEAGALKDSQAGKIYTRRVLELARLCGAKDINSPEKVQELLDKLEKASSHTLTAKQMRSLMEALNDKIEWLSSDAGKKWMKETIEGREFMRILEAMQAEALMDESQRIQNRAELMGLVTGLATILLAEKLAEIFGLGDDKPLIRFMAVLASAHFTSKALSPLFTAKTREKALINLKGAIKALPGMTPQKVFAKVFSQAGMNYLLNETAGMLRGVSHAVVVGAGYDLVLGFLGVDRNSWLRHSLTNMLFTFGSMHYFDKHVLEPRRITKTLADGAKVRVVPGALGGVGRTLGVLGIAVAADGIAYQTVVSKPMQSAVAEVQEKYGRWHPITAFLFHKKEIHAKTDEIQREARQRCEEFERIFLLQEKAGVKRDKSYYTTLDSKHADDSFLKRYFSKPIFLSEEMQKIAFKYAKARASSNGLQQVMDEAQKRLKTEQSWYREKSKIGYAEHLKEDANLAEVFEFFLMQQTLLQAYQTYAKDNNNAFANNFMVIGSGNKKAVILKSDKAAHYFLADAANNINSPASRDKEKKAILAARQEKRVGELFVAALDNKKLTYDKTDIEMGFVVADGKGGYKLNEQNSAYVAVKTIYYQNLRKEYLSARAMANGQGATAAAYLKFKSLDDLIKTLVIQLSGNVDQASKRYLAALLGVHSSQVDARIKQFGFKLELVPKSNDPETVESLIDFAARLLGLKKKIVLA